MNEKLKRYEPLVVLFLVLELGALAIEFSHRDFSAMRLMSAFMGLFFLTFALFKLVDLNGFARGFAKYDLIAGHSSTYAKLYPFLELGLAVLYLSRHYPFFANIFTLALMAISAAGVIRSLRRGDNPDCACLGTVLKVPLSTVSAVENIGMGLMALAMLAAGH